MIGFLWDLQDDSKFLGVLKNGTEVHCYTRSIQTVKTYTPIPREGKFFYEVLIIDSGEEDFISVGVCQYLINQHVGWDSLSIGYHGDDGYIFVEDDGKPNDTNVLFTSDDHIGVLLDYDRATLLFLREKKWVHKVELEPHFMNADLYPCVGLAKGGIIRLVTAMQGLY